MLVRDPLPGRAPLMEETHKSKVLIVPAVRVLAWIELAKRATVEKEEGKKARLPTSPYAVESEEIAS